MNIIFKKLKLAYNILFSDGYKTTRPLSEKEADQMLKEAHEMFDEFRDEIER